MVFRSDGRDAEEGAREEILNATVEDIRALCTDHEGDQQRLARYAWSEMRDKIKADSEIFKGDQAAVCIIPRGKRPELRRRLACRRSFLTFARQKHDKQPFFEEK